MRTLRTFLLIAISLFAAAAFQSPAMAADSVYTPPNVSYQKPDASHADTATSAQTATSAKTADYATTAGSVKGGASSSSGGYPTWYCQGNSYYVATGPNSGYCVGQGR